MAKVSQKLILATLCFSFVLGLWVMTLHHPWKSDLPFMLQPVPLSSRLAPRPVPSVPDPSNRTPRLFDPGEHHRGRPTGDGILFLPRQETANYNGSRLLETQPKNGSRFLIFECSGSGGLCGGWADRQEGLVTVFLLAYLTRRRFGLRMDTPCDVTNFVVPNHYDWLVSDAELSGKSSRRIFAIDFTDFSRQMSSMDFNARFPEDVLILRTNRDLWKDITINPNYRHLLPSWANRTRPEFFRDVWHTLMKASPAIDTRLQRFLDSVHYYNRSQPLVGVHVRTGGSRFFSDGKFGDRLSHLDALWAFLRPYVDNGSEVFMATDNPTVREQTLAQFGPRYHDTQVVLRHIDRQRNDPSICQAFGGAVLDQLILTRCDVLVVSPVSGFSSRAAMIRGTNRQLFQFDHDVSPADMYKMCDPIC